MSKNESVCMAYCKHAFDIWLRLIYANLSDNIKQVIVKTARP